MTNETDELGDDAGSDGRRGRSTTPIWTPKPAGRDRHRIVVGRPGADVSHADGRDSAAHAERRNHLARKIEITRAAFRRKLLCCDYVIRSAVKVLHRVHRGELPFDRTVQVSVTDRLEKDQILGRLAAQPGHARSAVGTQCGRLSRRHQQVAQAARSQGRVEAAQPPPLPGRAAGRRARPAHAADRADDRPARAVQRRGSISSRRRSSR